MKYAIYGAGSLGLVFAAFLKHHNEDFVIIDRNKKSVEAINNNGVKVVGKATMHENVKAILDSEVNEKFDYVLLFTKQLDNVNQVKKILGFLKDDGVICTMQNGLPEEQISEVIGKDRVMGAAVGWGATRLDYGISELTSENTKESLTFSFGRLTNSNEEIYNDIYRILSIMGTCVKEENFIGARYSKLLINCAFSGVSSLVGTTFGEASKHKESRKIIQRVIKECIDLANHLNIKIEKIQGKDVVKLVDYHSKFKKFISFMIIPLAIKKHKDLKASMLQDIEKGLKTEIDSINGIISYLGKKNNFATKFNDKVVEVIKMIENGEIKPSLENTKYFKDLF